jgi:hypothetical protein
MRLGILPHRQEAGEGEESDAWASGPFESVYVLLKKYIEAANFIALY